MCNCIECAGDQPEPGWVEGEPGKFAIYYKGEKLTAWHDTKTEAWTEFDAKTKTGEWD